MWVSMVNRNQHEKHFKEKPKSKHKDSNLVDPAWDVEFFLSVPWVILMNSKG